MQTIQTYRQKYAPQAQQVSEDTANGTSNAPEKKFSAGAISATVWKNAGKGKDGPVSYRTVSFQRAYKDKKDDSWKHTSSLRLHDLPKATLVLQKAYEYLVIKENSESAEESF